MQAITMNFKLVTYRNIGDEQCGTDRPALNKSLCSGLLRGYNHVDHNGCGTPARVASEKQTRSRSAGSIISYTLLMLTFQPCCKLQKIYCETEPMVAVIFTHYYQTSSQPLFTRGSSGQMHVWKSISGKLVNDQPSVEMSKQSTATSKGKTGL